MAPASRLGEFDALYGQMLDRKKFADHSAYETVPALMAMDDERLRPELFFVRHEGEVIAGADHLQGRRPRGLSLWRDQRARRCRCAPAISCTGTSSAGCAITRRRSWYDLGGTDGFQGLHQFKKGMVGERGRDPAGAAGGQSTPPIGGRG